MCGIGLTLFPAVDNESTSAEYSSEPSSAILNEVRGALVDGISSRGPDYQSQTSHVLRYDEQSTTNSKIEEEEKYTGDVVDSNSNSESINSVAYVPLTSNKEWAMNLYASVLHMRGKELVQQPYEFSSKEDEEYSSYPYHYSFCWNGECYSHTYEYACTSSTTMINNNQYKNYDVADEEEFKEMEEKSDSTEQAKAKAKQGQISDTKMVMSLLHDAMMGSRLQQRNHSISTPNEGTEQEREVEMDHENNCHDDKEHASLTKALSHIHGEYSFILYRYSDEEDSVDGTGNDKGCVYFGRDPFGRRSLLMSATSSSDNEDDTTSTGRVKTLNSLVLSSVNISDDDGEFNLEELPAGRVYKLDLNTGHLCYRCIPKPETNTFQRRVEGGGEKERFTLLPKYNVKFEMENEVTDVSPKLFDAARHLYSRLDQAVRRRVVNAPIPLSQSSNVTGNDGQENQASVAVLFSGGVDSVVLAALCHNHVPKDQPIDLINVAFATTISTSTTKTDTNTNTNTTKTSSNNNDPYSRSPDRQAAILSFQEMKQRWPERQWHFITVNVEYSEVLEEEERIRSLIAPRMSTMDFNIGTAFWFASRGRGEIVNDLNRDKNSKLQNSEHLRFADSSGMVTADNISKSEMTNATISCSEGNYECRQSENKNGDHNQRNSINIGKDSESQSMVQNSSPTSFTSRARVILVGIGADEQMAGYARHRTTYNRGGYDALREELKMEKGRLWTRNLGRDDRCISFHGKEARFPFLDEDVVAYLGSLDVVDICDMRQPQGLGDKMILRLVAKHIGVGQCSGLIKRAIQFGSRIAKCSDVDRFGSSRKASGRAQLGKTQQKKTS